MPAPTPRPTPDGDSGGNGGAETASAGLIGGVVAGVAVLAALSFAAYWYMRSKGSAAPEAPYAHEKNEIAYDAGKVQPEPSYFTILPTSYFCTSSSRSLSESLGADLLRPRPLAPFLH